MPETFTGAVGTAGEVLPAAMPCLPSVFISTSSELTVMRLLDACRSPCSRPFELGAVSAEQSELPADDTKANVDPEGGAEGTIAVKTEKTGCMIMHWQWQWH
jgi:hypothetical protein